MADDYTPTTDDVFAALHEAGIDTAPAYRWLAAHDREVAAKAWDEGREAVAKALLDPPDENWRRPLMTNPYRADG